MFLFLIPTTCFTEPWLEGDAHDQQEDSPETLKMEWMNEDSFPNPVPIYKSCTSIAVFQPSGAASQYIVCQNNSALTMGKL